jgi:uncharacterized protein (TIGR03382 family)
MPSATPHHCAAPLALLTLAAAGSTCLAQSGTATWQCSIDDGATWTSTLTLDAPRAVRVRLTLGWSGIPDAICFGGSQFDAMIINAAPDDSVSNISRPNPFNFAAQTLAATPYSQGIKIDVASDTALPGAGPAWIIPGQGTLDSLGAPPDTSNPAAVFTYTLNIGSTAGTRTISHIFNPQTGRALSIYTSIAGAQTRLSADQVTISDATIQVIPTPGTLALAGLGGLAAARRRR